MSHADPQVLNVYRPETFTVNNHHSSGESICPTSVLPSEVSPVTKDAHERYPCGVVAIESHSTAVDGELTQSDAELWYSSHVCSGVAGHSPKGAADVNHPAFCW